MVKQYVWIAIAGAVFATGIGIGYGIFSSISPQNSFLANQQQMLSYMEQNPHYMQDIMMDSQFQNQMFSEMRQNQQYHRGMMGGMMGDSMLRQQMMDYLWQDPQFRDDMMSRWNSTGMMGGPMMGQ